MTNSIVQLVDKFAQDEQTYKMYEYRVHVHTVSVRVYINRITRKSYGYMQYLYKDTKIRRYNQCVRIQEHTYVHTLKATATRKVMNILSYCFAHHRVHTVHAHIK